MKRVSLVIIVLSLLMLLFAVPVLAADIKDVAPNSPSYGAVKTLVEKGYLPLYEGGLFNGEKPVDRYTLASVIAKLLQDIEDGTVTIEGPDAELLKELTVDFRKELVLLSEDAGNLKSKLGESERSLMILKEDIAQTLMNTDKLNKTVGTLEEQLESLRADINAQDAKKKALEKELNTLKAQFDDYKAAVQAELDKKDAELSAYKAQMESKLQTTQLYILGALLLGFVL